MGFTIGMSMIAMQHLKQSTNFLNKTRRAMIDHYLSNRVTNHPLLLVTSLINNNSKSMSCFHYKGCHISCNSDQMSKVYQLVTKLLKLPIYQYLFVTTFQKVISTSPRVRAIMVIGLPNYTKPLDPCSMVKKFLLPDPLGVLHA